jgi:hypothetical protein
MFLFKPNNYLDITQQACCFFMMIPRVPSAWCPFPAPGEATGSFPDVHSQSIATREGAGNSGRLHYSDGAADLVIV